MKAIALVLLLAAGDDYYLTPEQAPEASTYNERADYPGSDYDHDGTWNALDVWDDQQLTPVWPALPVKRRAAIPVGSV